MINGKEFDITSEDKSYITPRVYITRVGEFSVYIAQGGIKRVFFLYVYDIYRYHTVFLSIHLHIRWNNFQFPWSMAFHPYNGRSQKNNWDRIYETHNLTRKYTLDVCWAMAMFLCIYCHYICLDITYTILPIKFLQHKCM